MRSPPYLSNLTTKSGRHEVLSDLIVKLHFIIRQATGRAVIEWNEVGEMR